MSLVTKMRGSLNQSVLCSGGKLRNLLLVGKTREISFSEWNTGDKVLSISRIESTTNNILKIETETGRYYFRECRVHDFADCYVRQTVESFFSDSKKAEAVLSALSDPKRFNSFFYMGVKYDKGSPAGQFFESGDLSLVGLDGLGPFVTYNDLHALVQYCWGEFHAYHLNSHCSIGELQAYNLCRSQAYEIVANALGLARLTPPSRTVILEYQGKSLKGSLMGEAPGLRADCIDKAERLKNLSGSIQRELVTLNILDVICHERDHRPDNYNVLMSDDEVVVCAFDNDSPMSFSPSSSIDFSTYKGCSSLVDSNGVYNRPGFPRRVWERMACIDRKSLKMKLTPFLSMAQIRALFKRVDKLIAAVERAVELDRTLLLGDNDWDCSILDRELSGVYGCTYLDLYLKVEQSND